jgi:hypothetical protein
MQPGTEPKLLITEDGRLVGVTLSADATSEHEWGIDGIRRMFGIDKTLPGILSRKITKVPATLRWIDWDDGTCGFGVFSKYEVTGTAKVPHGIDYFRGGSGKPKGVGQIAGAWDEASFGVRVTDDLREQLRTVFDGFATNDICIMIGGGPIAFAAHGLMIVRYSLLPASVDQQLQEKQKEAQEIKDYEEKSGIKARLRQAGCQFGYLGAKKMHDGTWGWWLNNGKNPNRQYHEDLHGWYTLEQLEQWARGEGPIAAFPKPQENRKKARRSSR